MQIHRKNYVTYLFFSPHTFLKLLVDHVGIKIMKTCSFPVDTLRVDLPQIFIEARQNLEHLLTVI